MRIPRVTDPPERIYLQVGDIDRDCEFGECGECGEVTWCADQQWPTDIEYRLVKHRKRVSDDSPAVKPDFTPAKGG